MNVTKIKKLYRKKCFTTCEHKLVPLHKGHKYKEKYVVKRGESLESIAERMQKGEGNFSNISNEFKRLDEGRYDSAWEYLAEFNYGSTEPSVVNWMMCETHGFDKNSNITGDQKNYKYKGGEILYYPSKFRKAKTGQKRPYIETNIPTFEIMIVDSSAKKQDLQSYHARTIWEVFERYQNLGGRLNWEDFKGIVRRRELTTGQLVKITNLDTVQERWVIHVPVVSNTGERHKVIVESLRNDRGQSFVDGISNGDYVYSKNYGWIDMGHAGFLGGKQEIKQLFNRIHNANPNDNIPFDLWSGKVLHFFGKRIEVPVNKCTISVKMRASVDELTAQGITLFIFKAVSKGFEETQIVTDWLKKSSFAEEDLPSNIICFYLVVLGYTKSLIEKECDFFSKEESLWVYRRYKFQRNKSFEPILLWPKSRIPKIFKKVQEVSSGKYWVAFITKNSMFSIPQFEVVE